MASDNKDSLSPRQRTILDGFLDGFRGVTDESLAPHIKATLDRESAHVRGAIIDLGLSFDSRDSFYPLMIGAVLGSDWTARIIAEGELEPPEASKYMGMLLARFYFEEMSEHPSSEDI